LVGKKKKKVEVCCVLKNGERERKGLENVDFGFSEKN